MMADKTESTISLNMLQAKLQSSRKAVLSQIKSEIAGLHQEIKKDISSLREETRADIFSVRSELANELLSLQAVQGDISREQADMDNALSETMDRLGALEEAQEFMAKDCKKLQEKCMDLENRSRRQNLRLISIEEGADAGQSTKFAAAFFPEVLGEDHFDTPVMIDRAQRTLAPKSKRGERPHAMLVRLHYYSDKEKILGLSKSKGRLTYKGALVHIFPDLSPEVGKLRVAFNPVKAKLRDTKIEYSQYYPAKLTLTQNGIRYSFDYCDLSIYFLRTILTNDSFDILFSCSICYRLSPRL